MAIGVLQHVCVTLPDYHSVFLLLQFNLIIPDTIVNVQTHTKADKQTASYKLRTHAVRLGEVKNKCKWALLAVFDRGPTSESTRKSADGEEVTGEQ